MRLLPSFKINIETDSQETTSNIQDEIKEFFGDIVSKNNQNTLLLDRVFEAEISNDKNTQHSYYYDMVAFQGESRIFIFDGGKEGDITDLEQEDRKEQCRNILLKLYVAPIIRIGKIASTFFGILDNAIFACVLLLLFGSGFLNADDVSIIEKIIQGDYGQGVMMVIVCSDLLHNIMHSSTRLWNLGRVDLPLVLVLYALYFIMLEIIWAEWVYWYLVFFRFCAFYVTTSCDYWIEVMIHNMVMNLKEGHDFMLLPYYLGNFVSCIRYPTSRLNKDDKEALKHFKGTFCAWNWTQSTLGIVKKYHEKSKFQELPSNISHFFFYFGGVLAFVAVFLLSILVFLLGAIACILAYVILRLLSGFDWGIQEEIFLW